MPAWGVPPYRATRLDAAGCSLVESVRAGRERVHDIASSLKKIRDLLSEFSPDEPKLARDALLWTLLKDACCGTEFEPDTLWSAFLVGAIPE